MSHGLDRIQWNNEGETMGHPPETSREVAEKILEYFCVDAKFVDEAAALIDAWVRVREASAIEEAAQLVELVTARSEGRDTTAAAIRALASARKQLGEKL